MSLPLLDLPHIAILHTCLRLSDLQSYVRHRDDPDIHFFVDAPMRHGAGDALAVFERGLRATARTLSLPHIFVWPFTKNERNGTGCENEVGSDD